MKVEQREVVVTKEVFIAVDGTTFDDEDDCLEHEYFINEAKLALYDHKFEKSTLDSCSYVRLDTEEDVELMRSLCEYQGLTDRGIIEPGIYMYMGHYTERWINISEVIMRIRGGSENAEN